MTMTSPNQLNWISESEFMIGNKVYHSNNPEWLENLFKNMSKENDNDTPKDQEATKTT